MRRIATYLGAISVVACLPSFAYESQAPSTQGPSVTTRVNGSTKEAVTTATQMGNSFLHNIFNSTNRPDWLTRTDINYDLQQKNTPVTSIETIQPLFQNRWSTWFWQGRAAYNDGDGIGNIGLGYRYLTDDRNLMWGLNTFYDETMNYNHKRLGFGGEIFTRYLTFRANYYDALSGKRNTGSANSMTGYQQALSGYDASIETPVPYVSWMRFVAQGYRWKGVHMASTNGGQANLRVFPARQLEMDLGVAGDNINGGQAFLKLNYYLGSPAFIENSATTPSFHGSFAAQDLEKQRLQKVIRHNDMVVEKTTFNNGSDITIGRGN